LFHTEPGNQFDNKRTVMISISLMITRN